MWLNTTRETQFTIHRTPSLLSTVVPYNLHIGLIYEPTHKECFTFHYCPPLDFPSAPSLCSFSSVPTPSLKSSFCFGLLTREPSLFSWSRTLIFSYDVMLSQLRFTSLSTNQRIWNFRFLYNWRARPSSASTYNWTFASFSFRSKFYCSWIKHSYTPSL